MKGLLKMFCPQESTVAIYEPTEKEKKTARDNKDRIGEKLEEYRKLDDAAKDFYRTYEPSIQIEQVGNKIFVRLGDQEFIAEYCTDIQITELGSPPCSEYHILVYNEYVSVNCASNAVIVANMVSGRIVEFTCNRHAVDITYAALQMAHRDAVGMLTPLKT